MISLSIWYQVVPTLLIAGLGASIVSQCLSLRRHVFEAKRIGLPHVIAPFVLDTSSSNLQSLIVAIISFAFLETKWLLLEPLLLPIFKRLPERWTSPWLPLSVLIEVWRAGYLPFASLGHDTFIIVTPSGLHLWSCDAGVNEQILAGPRTQFPKATEILGVMNTWGPTLPASEGESARIYRRVTGPCFNEATHRHVWHYGLERVAALMGELRVADKAARDSSSTATPFEIVGFCKDWTLSVICAVCYGKRLETPENRTTPPGFKLDFSAAVSDAFHYFFTIFLVPKLLLKYLPVKKFNHAYLAYMEWFKHLASMRSDEQARQKRSQGVVSQSNILGRIVASEAAAGEPEGIRSDGTAVMSTSAVYGIMSNFIVAGHETTANTLAFIVTMLALKPEIQALVRQELSSIFADRLHAPQTWSFEEDFPLLMSGLIGAVQNETMRLFPLSPTSTRRTLVPQTLLVNESPRIIPAGVRCFPNIPATHTNPRYWGNLLPPNRSESSSADPTSPMMTMLSPSFVRAHKFDMWDPLRWLTRETEPTASEQPLGAFEDSEPQAPHPRNVFGRLKVAKPGTFLPFSRGPRGCIGVRFAHVELCAFMAALFAEFEVRVDTRGFESAEEARRAAVEKITTKATTTLTYKPADDLRLAFVPLAR